MILISLLFIVITVYSTSCTRKCMKAHMKFIAASGILRTIEKRANNAAKPHKIFIPITFHFAKLRIDNCLFAAATRKHEMQHDRKNRMTELL